MHRENCEKQFTALFERLSNGNLDQDSFEKEVEDLSYQDKNGDWHRIDSTTGNWIYWDGMQWQPETETVRQDEQNIPPFGPLIKQILKITWQNFKRRLPLTLLLMLGTGAVYFYFVVVRWGGYGAPAIPQGPFFALELTFSKMLGVGDHGLTGVSSGLSSAVLLGVGLPLFLGFLRNLFTRGPIKAVGEVVSIPKQLGGYFHAAGGSAMAGLASGAGIAMVIGSFMGSWANVMLAVGAGTMLSSRLGQVISMLFRSFWAATFGIVQKGNVKQFSQAAGYIALFGGSFAFMLRSVVPPEMSMFMGLGFLVFALFLAMSSGGPSPTIPASGIVFLITVGLLASAMNGFADDGGWAEVPQADKNAIIHFLQWLMSQGGFEGLINCLLPGFGAMFGPAFFAALNQALGSGVYPVGTGGSPGGFPIGDTPDGQPDGQPERQSAGQQGGSEKNESHGPQLFDPDTGEPLIVQDGSYEGGKPGQVWYDGEWMDPKEARHWINERKNQLRDRQNENKDFWNNVERDNADRRAQRERDLQAQGAKWDPDKQAWVGGTKDPGDPKLNEIYNRGDWVRDHMSDLTPEQQAAAQRILDRIGADETGVNPDDLSDKDMNDLRRLTQAMNDLNTGKNEMEGAVADSDAANALLAEQVAQATAQIGQMAANRVDPTGGIATNALFGAAQNWDKGVDGALKHAAVNAAGGWVDSKLGNLAPENIGLNAASGAATNATQTWILGGSDDDIKWAAGIGGLAGGMSAASNQLDRYLNDRKLPTIPAGDDPTLAAGSHGIGSNDEINMPDSGPPSMAGSQATHSSTPSTGPRVSIGDADGGLVPPRAAAPETTPSTSRGIGADDAGIGSPSRTATPDEPSMTTPHADTDGSSSSRMSRGDADQGTGPAPRHDTDGSEGMGATPHGDTDEPSTSTTQGQEADADGVYDMGTPPTKDEQDELLNQLRGDSDLQSPDGGGADDGTLPQAEGYDHVGRGSSVEETGRHAEESIWVLSKNGEPKELLPTGAADYKPKPGEVLASKKRFDDTFNVKKRGPGMTDREFNQLVDKYKGNLPEGRGYNPAPHAPDADADGRYDVGNRTPDQAQQEADELIRQMGGSTARAPEDGSEGVSGISRSEGSDPPAGGGNEKPLSAPEGPPTGSDGESSAPGEEGPPKVWDKPKEQEILDNIKQSVADDPKLQRAEAADEKLRRGEDPDFDPDREIPFSGKDWRAQDAAKGGPREEFIPSGVDRPPEMQQLIDRESTKYPWLDGVDKRVRAAWAKVGGGTEPDAWARFQKEVNPSDYERWHKVRIEGGIKQTELNSAPTMAPSPKVDD